MYQFCLFLCFLKIFELFRGSYFVVVALLVLSHFSYLTPENSPFFCNNVHYKHLTIMCCINCLPSPKSFIFLCNNLFLVIYTMSIYDFHDQIPLMLKTLYEIVCPHRFSIHTILIFKFGTVWNNVVFFWLFALLGLSYIPFQHI